MSEFLHITPVHILKSRVRAIVSGLIKDEEKSYILEIALRKHPALKEVRVVYELGSVMLRFSPLELKPEQALKLIDSIAGNVLRVPRRKSSSQKPELADCKETNMAIEGMTCASCAALIQLSLRRDKRIREANVNFAAATAKISGQLEKEEIFGLIKGLGYSPLPMDTLAQRRLLAVHEQERLQEAKMRALLACSLSLPVMIIGMLMPHSFFWRFIEFALSTPVVLGTGRVFFSKALKLARQKSANMDSLIALGTGAAYGHSLIALLRNRHDLYFEAAAGIVSFVLLGRFLEEQAKGKASEAIRGLLDLQPPSATLWENGEEKIRHIDEIKLGDTLIIRPGERIPLDGEVIWGLSTVDESMLTGESIPVVKDVGMKLVGGCINGSGALRMRVGAVGGDTVLAGIIRMVDNAQASKLPIQKLADRVSAVFVPGVVGIAGLTLLGWLIAGRGLGYALTNAVAVLLIACPCALGLATPTAIMTGTGQAARRGIFIKEGEALETASRLSALIFDKTGTITQGKPMVVRVMGAPEEDWLAWAAGAEQASEHHFARAILDYARSRNIVPLAASSFNVAMGKGVEALVAGKKVWVGNRDFLASHIFISQAEEASAEAMAEAGQTPIWVGIDKRIMAILGIADPPRAGAKEAIAALHALGIKTLMVTGDLDKVARHIARQVGIEAVVAQASPERKLEILQELRELGEVVGMIGDGINDAPALASANVGFAIGQGTDIAMESAGLTLAQGDIAKVAEMIILSQKTMRIIKQNLFWALAYNTTAIPLAALGRLSPMIASFAMAASSISVVANSLRLRK